MSNELRLALANEITLRLWEKGLLSDEEKDKILLKNKEHIFHILNQKPASLYAWFRVENITLYMALNELFYHFVYTQHHLLHKIIIQNSCEYVILR